MWIEAILVEADSGAIGGKFRTVYVTHWKRWDTVISCPTCGYTEAEKAVFNKGTVKNDKPLPIDEVATPGIKTIEELANYLKVMPNQTMKAVF